MYDPSLDNRIRARRLVHARDYESSVPLLQSVISRHDTDPNATIGVRAQDYGFLGVAYLGLHRWEDVVTALNFALDLNPRSFIDLNNRASAFVRLNKIDKAISDFEAAVELNPEYPAARLGLGQMRILKREYDLALEAINVCIDVLTPLIGQPGSAVVLSIAHRRRGFVYCHLENDFVSARTDFERAFELDRSLPKFRDDLGSVPSLRKDFLSFLRNETFVEEQSEAIQTIRGILEEDQKGNVATIMYGFQRDQS